MIRNDHIRKKIKIISIAQVTIPCDSNKIRTSSSNFSQRESIINILRNEISLRKKKWKEIS